MDEIDPADQVPDLVALQPTDEMPPNLRSKLLILRHGLLDPVFSEIPLSRRDRIEDERGGVGLAHGHERDALRVPPGALGRGVDPLPHTLEGGGDRAHREPSTHVMRAWRFGVPSRRCEKNRRSQHVDGTSSPPATSTPE